MDSAMHISKEPKLKNLYLIGGTMGIGKTTVCRALQQKLENSVFLDGDWCWDAHPFQVTEETKQMVMQNICFLLNQFLRCSAYEHVIFCWVMHEQSILESILENIDAGACRIHPISLICSAQTLRRQLEADIAAGVRDAGILSRSIPRLPLYQRLNTVKISTDGKTPEEIAEEILAL